MLFASVQVGDTEVTLSDGRFFAHYRPKEFLDKFEEARMVVVENWITADALFRAVQWVNVIAKL